MKLFYKAKNTQGSQLYFLGIKIYELRKTQEADTAYLFGVKVRNKRSRKLVQAEALRETEEKILQLRESYQSLPESERLILCFDCLYDPLAEAIDAWTLFEYLQSQGIPSRYALLKTNPLYAKLEKEDRLTNILPVDNERSLLRDHADIIARCKKIFFSFPFTCSRVLLNLPQCPFIFIEHGVNLLKPWCIRLYTEGGDSECNYILTPSKPTKALYEKMGLMNGRMISCGLPRWDKLAPHSGEAKQKEIFIFFTWRTSFIHNKQALDIYMERIGAFVTKLQALIENQPHIRLNISFHHALLVHNQKYQFNRFENIRIVDSNELSSMIRRADLFITDYSSACFDLMYRNVPTIFYRFDTDLTYSEAMDNEVTITAPQQDSLLYNCCYSLNDAVNKVQHYIDNGFLAEEELLHKNENIFWPRINNCRRLVELTKDITE